MTTFVIAGNKYSCVRGSEVGRVDRDGMYLELSDANSDVILEIFYSDQTNLMTLTAHKEDIPLEVVEWLIAQAKTSLPPIEGDQASQGS